MKKNKAGFKAIWGNGLGGACPEELHADTVRYGSVIVTCHYVQAGVEYWRFVSSKTYPGFNADAWANPASEEERNDIISILTNLRVK